MKINNFFHQLAVNFGWVALETDDLIRMFKTVFADNSKKDANEFCLWLVGKKLLAQEWKAGNTTEKRPRDIFLNPIFIEIVGDVSVNGLTLVDGSYKHFERKEIEVGDILTGKCVIEEVHVNHDGSPFEIIVKVRPVLNFITTHTVGPQD